MSASRRVAQKLVFIFRYKVLALSGRPLALVPWRHGPWRCGKVSDNRRQYYYYY